MKIKLILLFILSASNLFAQYGVDTKDPFTNPKLPSVIPVSPIAAELGMYGNLPLNLSTGRLNNSINLYEIKVGNYSYPITINYNFGGLMAEQRPSWTGLGWTLNVPGAITRQVYGMPDDIQFGYIFKETNNQTVAYNNVKPYFENILNLGSSGFDKLDFYEKVGDGKIDTEPDKFNINSFTLSGNFFFNWNREAKMSSPYRDYKIEPEFDVNGGIKSITIIDEEGVIYEFSEREFTYTATTSSGDGFHETNNYPSSFYISKIRFPYSNDEITFQYEGYSFFEQVWTKTTKLKESFTQLIGVPNISITDTHIEAKVLAEINFPNGKVLFDNTGSNLEGTPFLKSISVFDNSSPTANEILKYDFTYSIESNTTNSVKLRTLSKIERKSGAQILPFYEFEYNGTLPVVISREAQDYWGFYNQVLSPDITDDTKRQPQFSKSSIGALTKIKYPTGGFTNITYEKNLISRVDKFSSDDFYCGDIEFNTDSGLVANDSGTGEQTYQINLPNSVDDQIIRVYLRAESNSIGSEAKAEVILNSDMSPYLKCNYVISSVSSYDSQGLFYEEFYINITQGQDFQIKLNSIGDGVAKYQVYYYDSNLTVLNTAVGGIRVKETEDCSELGDCITKEYKYAYDDNNSTGFLVNTPVYLVEQWDENIPLGSSKYYRYVRKFESNVPMATYNGSHILYRKVTVLENGNEINGKTEYFFTGEQSPAYPSPWAYRDYESWKQGLVDTLKQYKKEGTVLSLVNEETTTFKEYNPYLNNPTLLSYNNNLPLGFKAQRYVLDGNEPPSFLSDYNTSETNMVPKFFVDTLKVKKEYFGSSEIENFTYSSFNEFSGRIASQITSTSLDSKTFLTTYKYPSDFPNDPVLEDLIQDHHIVSMPVEIVKNQVVGTQSSIETLQTVRQSYHTDSNRIMPYTVETDKNGDNSFEERIIFHQFDSHGNLVDVSLKDGTRISYLWGYNGQYPVAKVENATYSDITSVSGLNLSVINNPSSSTALKIELNKIRSALTEAMVTTLTYIPLIGIESVTDPRGYTMFYEYDDFNRLKYVRDKDENILSKNEYNFRPSN